MPRRVLIALFAVYILLTPIRGSLGEDAQTPKSTLLEAPAGRLPVKIDPRGMTVLPQRAADYSLRQAREGGASSLRPRPQPGRQNPGHRQRRYESFFGKHYDGHFRACSSRGADSTRLQVFGCRSAERLSGRRNRPRQPHALPLRRQQRERWNLRPGVSPTAGLAQPGRRVSGQEIRQQPER